MPPPSLLVPGAGGSPKADLLWKVVAPQRAQVFWKLLVRPAMLSHRDVPRLTCEKELSLAFGGGLGHADERCSREQLDFGARGAWAAQVTACHPSDLLIPHR